MGRSTVLRCFRDNLYIAPMKSIHLLGMLCLLASCSKNETPPPDMSDPTLRSESVFMIEGNGGISNMEFTFTLSKASTKTVSVQLTSTDGFAKVGEDYRKVDQTLQFAPGETTKKVVVEIVADDAREGEDDFLIGLTNPVNCTVFTPAYKGTIQNDDTKVVFATTGPSSPNTYPGLTLVWADEFNGTSVNTSDWNYEEGDGCPNLCGWGNNELEFYTAGNNASVQSGALVIEARKETRGTRNYTSTRMTTKTKRPFKFGRMDIRAKLPYGQGIWPAFWMMPQDDKFGTWPRSGEIDIMEFLGHETNKVYSTIHYGPGPGSINISRNTIGTAPFNDAFHVYSLIWEADRLRFLVDDVVFSDIRKADLGSNNYPFNESFFFIFNLAVGGNWPGAPNATTYFPQWLIVDYVRVFQ